MNCDSDIEEICTTPDILEEADISIINLIPEKSRKKYETVYKAFMDWRGLKNISSFSESVLLTYFEELSEKYKSTSLWAHYSMLKSTLNINHSVNIEMYLKLRAFLKRKSEGYQTKEAKTFTPDEINTFIKEAPDDIYLVTKVALIMGILGACRANELHSISIDDFQDLGSAILVTVPNSKTNIVRKFTITGYFYNICKKYVDLRPSNIESTSLFLNYQNGKCTAQSIGINKLGAMGKQIAEYLKLPNPKMYTGHSFRKSSATLLVDEDGHISALKRNGRWKSISVEEAFVDDPLREPGDKIFQSVKQSTSTYTQKQNTTNETINFDINSKPTLNFTNCSNITINFITNK